MALSPNYNWSEPDNSSLVKDGALAMRTLGDAIDTSVWNVGYGQAGKNKIINGDFGVWQRGTSAAIPNATFARLADRFHIFMNGTFSATQSQETFTPGTAPVSGYEGQYFWRNTISSITSISLNRFGQKIEDVRTFAGQTVTVSFWAKAGANASWTPQLVQEFGSGGSAAVFASGSAVSVTTSWQRFTQTISVPSISGKTIGAGSCLTFIIDMPLSGAQTNDVWGVQVEVGSVATPFQTASGGSIQGELAMCQRYYQRITGNTNNPLAYGANSTTSVHRSYIYFPVEMRTAPTALEQSGTASDYAINQFSVGVTTCTALITFFESSNKSILVSNTLAAATLTTFQPGGIRANATGAYLGWSAEL
jgi:hypothetical protein